MAETHALDQESIRLYAQAQALLSAIWSLEDGRDCQPALRVLNFLP